MATRKEVELQFVRWNCTGIGPDTLTAGNWFFRGSVLFYHLGPYKRFVKRANGVMLSIDKQPADSIEVLWQPTGSSHVGNDKFPAFRYEHWSLPTIGVLSRYEGDMLSIGELHERMRYLFIAQLAAFEDDYVRPLGGPDITTQTITTLTSKVARMYDRYRCYTDAFKLRWPELPTLYRDQIMAAIKAKHDRYHDPKAVAQRERSHARKVAKQAFELDG